MLGLVNRPSDISLSRANQSQAKFKSGVGGNLLQSWVNMTIVDGRKSAPQHVTSDVPQSSVLGPLLFLILIEDTDQNTAFSFISSFADDTRVGRHIEDFEDIQLLQADLDVVYYWAESNNMEFNSDQFELLRYRLRGSTVQNLAGYKSNIGSEIEEKAHVKNLGVKLSSNTTFSEHIGEKVASVKTKIRWVLRTFRTREHHPMLALWKYLILCDLDYCSQLWNPNKTGDIQALELLQKWCFAVAKTHFS